MTTVISCRNVTKRYQQHEILKQVDLEVSSGEILLLFAPSGEGKTTLLNLICGLTLPSSGSIEILGTELSKLSEDERARFRASSISLAHQGTYLIPWLSVDDNLALSHIPGSIFSWAETVYDALGIRSFADIQVNRLSGGQRRRVCMQRALQTGAPVLLLDEPTNGLDHQLTDVVCQAIQDRAAAGSAVILASHDPSVRALAHSSVTIRDRKLMPCWPPPI